MTRKTAIILGIVIIALGGWYFRLGIQNFFRHLPQLEQVASNNAIVQNLAQNIFAPDPLRSGDNYENSVLTKQGVISWTNVQRQQNGDLPALRENAKLDASATMKLRDMFAKQYFEHVSPSGTGPGNLADAAGYRYIIIGENLALGNFKDDQALVDAWMNSPGHRANILNSKFEEIGVAVGKGSFEGRQVWLAVQEFGKPASSCPAVDANLKQQIDSLRSDVNSIQPQLQALQQDLKSENPQTKSEYDAYNQKVSDYNALVKIYNNKIDQLRQDTDTYNAQVNAYNACAQ